MPRARLSAALLLLAAPLALARCAEKAPREPDEPPSLVDACDSAAAAAANEACRLTVGEEKSGYISPLGDVDWYVFDLASPLPPRPLLTVTARYTAPFTPVTLSINVLRADAQSSLGSARDPKPRGSPGLAQVVARLSANDAGRYFVVMRHDTGADDPAHDKANAYSLTVALGSDADDNEPNDEVPTDVALPACGAAQAQGALATRGDVDRFRFTVSPCASGRTILHLQVEAPTPSPQGIRVEYLLDGPQGRLAMDHAGNPFREQALATARLVTAGTYELTVRAYRLSSDPEEPAGDPAFTYQVRLALYPDIDENEGASGNDAEDQATVATPAQRGTPRLLTGRISAVGDVDVFSVTATGERARLYYKVEFARSGGRFPAVPTQQMRELNVFTRMPSEEVCKATCPNGATSTLSSCLRSQCLWSRRVEGAPHGTDNFEGLIRAPLDEPVYLQIGFQGNSGADDLEYTLTVELRDETADEALGDHKVGGPAVVVNLPASGVAVLGHGRGQVASDRPHNGLDRVPRGPMDYDALDDVDVFELRFTPLPRPPPPGPDGGLDGDAGVEDGGVEDAGLEEPDAGEVDAGPDTVDHALTLAWSIPPASGQRPGERSYDVGLRLHFCVDKACSRTVSTRGYLGYKSAPVKPWYPEEGLGLDGGLGLQKPYWFEPANGAFGMQPVMCMCLEAQYAEAGKFWVEVQAQNRASYQDAPVTVQMSVGAYPPVVTDDQGRSFPCPTPCQWVTKSL